MANSRMGPANKALLVNADAVPNNTPIESDMMTFRTEQIGATFYTISTQGGSLQIQVYTGNPDNDPNSLLDADFKNMGAPRAIVANTLDVYTVQQGMMPLRVIYTPSGNPHTTKVFCWGFGG